MSTPQYPNMASKGAGTRDDGADRAGPGLVPALCRLLDEDARFVMKVLGALEAVGDGRAVPPVRRLAHSPDPSIRAMAQRILPILVERGRRDTATARLLRPADPGAPDTALLRPAAGRTAEAPLLLSAAPPEEDAA